MSGIVYKQRYAEAAKVPRASIPGLNVRHLQYIATRPGAIYNKGYGFGLFGSLEQNAPMADIRSLEEAKKLVRAESERGRTMFRAVVSLGEPDASERGFYDRPKWEQLIGGKMATIAQEMHIAPQDLRWCASMHCTAGHPHTHIIFWDAGQQPRQDQMPKVLFQKYAERIRAEFNREIYGAEISQARAEEQASQRALREELRALLPEANPSGVFSIPAMQKHPLFSELCERYQALIDHAPKRGSLKYAYLQQPYKDEIKAFVDTMLRHPSFAKVYNAYLDSAQHIAELYGNGKASIAAQAKRAEDSLYKSLANELLHAIRETLPALRQQLDEAEKTILPLFCAESSAYRALLEALPPERIPYRDIRAIPEYAALRDELRTFLEADARWKERLTDERLDKLMNATLREAQAEKGYETEARQTGTMGTLLHLFSALSRLSGRQQAQRRQLRRSHDASREAKQDRRAEKSQGSEVNFEME